jgi:hypothetical protein
MKQNRLRAAMSFALAGILTACSLPGGNSTPQKENTPTPVPTTTPTPPFTESSAATEAIPATETIVPTPTMELPQNGNVITDHPAFLNLLGTEDSGMSWVSVESVQKYFLQRLLAVASGNAQIQKTDRMFGQLSLPVNDLSDRSLNFDWQNNGQGLGFGTTDVHTLKTLSEVQQKQANSESVSQLDPDGNHRTWMVASARDFDGAVLAVVDEHLRIKGVESPATNPEAQTERQRLFEEIVYGDFGVKATDTDGVWQTVDDDQKFDVCETFTADASKREKQPEASRGVVFDPSLETGSNGPEQDTPKTHDSDNTILVAAVDSGTHLRVEAFDLADPTDSLNPGLDTFKQGSSVRAFGGRWIPCGAGIKANNDQTSQPTKLPDWPTPVPTNVHRDDPAPEEHNDVPDRVPATEIP